MEKKCMEQAELVCKNYPNCNGCNAFRVPTNFDRLKQMDTSEAAVLISALVDCCRDVSFASDATVPLLVKKWLESEVTE